MRTERTSDKRTTAIRDGMVSCVDSVQLSRGEVSEVSSQCTVHLVHGGCDEQIKK